jgi:hypothetical protein
VVTAAQVIIHFVGLCMFSNQVPNDCGQKVILPRLVYQDPTARAERVLAPSAHHIGEPVVVPGRLGPQPHVEDHVALLVFKMSSYLVNVNWGPPTPLPGDPSYGYVKLDGDRIRILSGLPDQQLETSGLKLPPLQTLCPSMTDLSANFQPPYTGAAAVVDLPQGTMNSCKAGARVDTEVNLNVAATFVISASTMRVRKEIRLRGPGNVELIVANVPVACLSPTGCTPATGIAGVTHAHAYYEMGAQSASCNASVKAWYDNASLADKPTTACSIVVPGAAGGYGMAEAAKGGPMSSPQMTNFECSNTKWP